MEKKRERCSRPWLRQHVLWTANGTFEIGVFVN